ncbi:MAG: YicC/YloC family endoribonuclease [Desulfobaccales bacterium]
MIRSMTAYGRGEAEGPSQKWVVEIRSLNHRFLELSLNLPKRLWGLEDRLRKLIKGRIPRGRVEMQLTWESTGEKPLTLKADQALARQTAAMLEEVRAAGGLKEPLHLENLLHFSDLFLIKETQELALEETWETVERAVSAALEDLDQMRLTEGQALAADLAKSLGAINGELERIRGQAPLLPQLWREKLLARLAELGGETGVDEARLAQEVVLLAERRDLSEELARLSSHLGQFGETLAARGPVGRKQEFLVQEMLREANTIGSKAGDLLITQAVLEIKGYLERLREQVQNIE